MNPAQRKAIMVRGSLTVIFLAGGLVFPLLWVIAAFFAYTTYNALPEPKPITPEDMWRPRQSDITADDPEWRTHFLNICESPAETAFVKAAIDTFDLRPNNGILVGSDLELDMQVDYRPYRLDFLVNKWLVVEVDGAAWHSSPEAVERDRIRDAFFVDKGFSVLRIPAKVVFDSPAMAADMVRAALDRGRPAPKVLPTAPLMSIGKTFATSLSSVSKFLDDLDSQVTKLTAIEKAMAPSKQAFATEKMVLDSALEAAKRAVDLEAELSADPKLKAIYDSKRAEFEQIIQKSRKNTSQSKITISPLSRPDAHPDAEINAAIVEAYENLQKDRTSYFNSVRAQISKDPRLSRQVQSSLEGLGCRSIWAKISTSEGSRLLDSFLKEAELRARGGT